MRSRLQQLPELTAASQSAKSSTVDMSAPAVNGGVMLIGLPTSMPTSALLRVPAHLATHYCGDCGGRFTLPNLERQGLIKAKRLGLNGRLDFIEGAMLSSIGASPLQEATSAFANNEA